MKSITYIVLLMLSAWLTSPVQAILIGISADGSQLYKINTRTAEATLLSSTELGTLGLGGGLAGIASGPRFVYGLRGGGFTDPDPEPALLRLDVFTGTSTVIGLLGLEVVGEGGLAYDRHTKRLYGTHHFVTEIPQRMELFSIDPQTGLATVIGDLGLPGDYNALTFTQRGRLLILDGAEDRLLTVDPANARIIKSVNLSQAVTTGGGMAQHPFTGVIMISEAGSRSNPEFSILHRLNPRTGELTTIGDTGVASGFSGLTYITPHQARIYRLYNRRHHPGPNSFIEEIHVDLTNLVAQTEYLIQKASHFGSTNWATLTNLTAYSTTTNILAEALATNTPPDGFYRVIEGVEE